MTPPAGARRGRFAPSPTGPLHFGSLVAALGSWLAARAAGAQWLVRIEDVDTPRSQPGAADDILRTLDRLGLHWAGTCREGPRAGRAPRSLRVRVHDRPIAFEDAVQGRFEQALESEVGDFVVRRADGLHAYHLAVVVDDAATGITDIVRGADLLDSTPRQIHLQALLDLPTPSYAHLPVAVNADGSKLSKQNHAPALDPAQAGGAVAAALAFLGHPPPAGLRGARAAELLSWSRSTFDLARIPRCAALPAPLS